MNDFKKQRKQKRFDDIKHTLRQAESIIEVVALSLIYYFVWKTMYDESGFYAYLGKGKYLLMTVYAIISFIIFNNCDSFKFGHMRLTDVLISQWISVILVNVITYFQLCLMANYMIKPYPMFILTLLEAMAVLIFSSLYSFIYHRLYVPKSMAMVYGMEDAITLKFKMDTRADKYQIKKLISIDEGYEKICDTIVKYDAVVINDVSAVIRNDILKFCYKNGIRVYITPKLTDIILRGAGDINLFDTPLLLVKGNGLTLAQRAVKRFFDVLLSLIAMIIASPIMLIVSLAIKLEDGGPVFYRQTRVTKNGKEFDILKFRSMVVDAEKNGEVIPAKGRDPRITKVGRIIRATRIDELPQIINIIKGDMSIVGPRPERVEHVKKYTEEIPEFRYRQKVKGGLTGYAQIYGKYNTSAYDKLRLDLMYIENYSLILDIKLILMTLQIMLRPESTEGFDKAEELKQKADDAISEIEASAPDDFK